VASNTRMMRQRLVSALTSADDAVPQIRTLPPKTGIDWVNSAWRLAGKNPTLWPVMSLFYTVVMLAMAHIPIFAVVIVPFLIPFVIAGALIAADDLAKASEDVPSTPKRRRSPTRDIVDLFSNAARQMFSVLQHDDKLASVFQLSIVVVILTVAAHAIVHGIAGSVLLDTVQLSAVGVYGVGQIGGALIVVVGFWFLIMTLLLYAVPLCALGDATAIGAIYYSYKAVMQNFRAFVVFLIGLSIPLIFIVFALSLSLVVGLVIAIIIGSISLPVVINGAFCVYKLTYRWH